MSVPADRPVMLKPRAVTGGWMELPAWLPVEGMGALPVNSYLLKGAEPLLVDTGLGMLGDAFTDVLETAVDPEHLCWIWLSHMDFDHIGNLQRVLERAPKARIITSFLGAGKLGLAGFDTARVHLLSAGERIEVGGRRLTALCPPYYDAPETLGFFDEREAVLFSADSFGAMLPRPVADITELDARDLRQGMVGWAAIDAPWLAHTDPAAFGRRLRELDRLAPKALLGGHLPAWRGDVDELTGIIGAAFAGGCGTAEEQEAVFS